ncbi:MAG: hydroxysqualene dehydroxylase HpnE [Bacteroidetes bacterium]|nr:hydroxysqualene dehydroxylase HpnE [Bacteroidota bacterium]
MKKCVVIGGGFAGLTAAAYLSNSGFQVELFEASPKLGGRAYSFYDNESGSIIDNGQHIMMGCYKETLEFFKLIDAENNLLYQKRLRVNFLKENFNLIPTKTFPLPYPLNLILGLLNYKAISISDRLLFLKFFLKLPFVSSNSLNDLSVFDWLIKENQNENIRKAFWEILAVGALNTNIKKTSASTFALILKEIFLKGNKSATIILPKFGLSETYCNSAVDFIQKRDGKINLLESVENLQINEKRIIEIETSKRKITDFDFVISTVPFYAAKKMIPQLKYPNGFEPQYSSILSVHVWLKENKLKEDFYGLINSPIHWIFNHHDHLTLVISDANELTEKSKEEIFELISDQLKLFVGISKDEILNYKIIKEKRATFIPSKEILSNRPDSKTEITNLFLAGDWINTGLPSTIESAVKSGSIAANHIIEITGN